MATAQIDNITIRDMALKNDYIKVIWHQAVGRRRHFDRRRMRYVEAHLHI